MTEAVLAPTRLVACRPKTSRYRVLGEGSSLGVSLVSAGLMFAAWGIATHSGWIKPLFLPKPEAIWSAFQQSVAGDIDGHTLWGHFAASATGAKMARNSRMIFEVSPMPNQITISGR